LKISKNNVEVTRGEDDADRMIVMEAIRLH